MLEIDNVHMSFGGLRALGGVSLSVKSGDFVGLIGPNGSGKTSLINCISGLYRPDSGHIRLDNRIITNTSPHRVYHLGIGRTFQVTKVFRRLTVLENLMIPALTERKLSYQAIKDRAKDVLTEINLVGEAKLSAGMLSGGQQKLLEIGMVMITEPRVLLLDEPFGGVHPELKTQLNDYLSEINANGRTIILVSHEMTSVFQICRRLAVLDRGVLIADGSPEEIRSDERVIKAYLGGGNREA